MRFPHAVSLLLIPLILQGTAAPVINEVFYAPDDKTTETEFLEIHNPDGSDLDLGGWTIGGGVEATIPAGTTLPSGGYLLLAENPAKLAAAFSIPPEVDILPFSQFLGNDGEDLLLRDDSGNLIDSVDYRREFPWPVSAGGDGPSMELLNPSLDNDLGGSWLASSGNPTPGAQNSTFTDNPAPQLRQVDHAPRIPTDQDDIVVTIKATDPDGIGNLTLSYQINSPGNYIPANLPLPYNTLTSSPSTPPTPNPAFEDPSNWTSIPMTAVAGDPDFFSATIPAQAHRTLVRYRITASDSAGSEVRAPGLDDPSKNFATFVYNGVPDYTAADSVHPDGDGKAYSSELLTSLPVYTILTRPEDLQSCYAYSGTPYSGQQISKGNRSARSVFNWECAFVYDGIVYDHVRYRLRQNNNRYAAGGKRSMRFRFNDGHYFQARDEQGDKWPVKWRTLNTGKMSTFSSATTYGIKEVVNSRIWRMAGIECPYFYHFHFRVIDDAAEAPNQHDGDFFGLGMAFEDIDGRLLEARDLPDGNLYKWKDGERNPLELQRNQERYSVTDGSDFSFNRSNLNSSRSINELESMVDWHQWSLYHTVCEAVRHYDFGTATSHQKNQAWYFQPSPGSTYGKIRLIPHDHDASWSRGYHDNIRIGIARDFPWRAIFSQSSTVGAPSDRSPLKPPYNLIYRNTVRNFRDLFWQEETIEPLINETLESIREFTYPDRDRWQGGSASAGRETSMGNPQGIVSGMMSVAFNNDLIDGSTLDGGRAAFLDILQEDDDIPATPVISYDGPANFPPGQLVFTSSNFSDPQGAATYASTQWRIAESPPAPGAVNTIFTTGADWKYRDTGEDLGTAWKENNYEDSLWANGPSPLGYNEDDLATKISFGPSLFNKHITAYFRKTINIPEPGTTYRMRILRDDGAAIYINGTEAGRFGLDSGPLTSSTTANENAPEGVYDVLEIPGTFFVAGNNTIAISLHQRSSGSSDTKLDVVLEEIPQEPEGPAIFEWNASWESGDVSGTSITPPAVATRTGRLYRARVRHLDSSGRPSHWSDPFEFTAGAADVTLYSESLVISEFLVDPRSATLGEQQAGWETADFEFIRLKNIGSQAIDLANVRFTKGIDLDLAGLLQPGAEITLARNPAAYTSRHPGSTPFGPWSGKLRNEGENLKLSFGAGEPIHEFEYFNSAAWPTSEENVAFSLALLSPDSNPNHGLASSWRPALEDSNPVFFTGDATADRDGDGVNAFIEHANGTSDLSPNTPLVLNNGEIAVSRNLNAADALLHLESSERLENWTVVPESAVLSSLITADGNWTVRYQYDPFLKRSFFRLKSNLP